MNTTTPNIAYIASQKLFLKSAESPAREIESEFAHKQFERDAQRRQRSEWKGGSMVWGSMQGQEAAGAGLPEVGDSRQVLFHSMSRVGDRAALLYVLQTGMTTGLFEYDIAEDYERRLIHRQGLYMADIARHPTADRLVCSLQFQDWSCNLARGDGEGRKLVEITEGDSRDECPAWAAGDSDRVVYQSAGIGRDHNGLRGGLGPYRIELIDLENDRHQTLRDEPEFDLMAPQLQADGSLYYIRRPYKPQGQHRDILTGMKDIALFPFRLGRAVFYFLEGVSIMFSGKPLRSAGGPPRRGANDVHMMLWGRVIESRRIQAHTRGREGKPLVPADWQLCRQLSNGEEQTLATHVVAFDVCPDGTVIYTDGARIMHRDAAGTTTQLHRARLVERVMVMA